MWRVFRDWQFINTSRYRLCFHHLDLFTPQDWWWFARLKGAGISSSIFPPTWKALKQTIVTSFLSRSAFPPRSSSRRYFDPQIIVLCILALISLHHIDEYKLLLTLSDVDSFSFYVFFLSKGERRNRCIKVLSLISSDILLWCFFSFLAATFFRPPVRFLASVSAPHFHSHPRLFIKLELLKLYFRV